ncbi:MAG: hypothetical protein IPH37_14070 [Burkholderiales bacterium]|nr:hypothetical protein [Burkholderiales bacterium]
MNPLKLLSQVFFIARIEAGFLVRFRRFALATLAVACIPALYAVIYLSSVWDPSAHTNALAVAMVNLDKGVSFHDNEFNIGNEVIQKLKVTQTFGYRDFTDEDEALLAVRQGKLAFALVIPPHFSSNAVPGARTGGGKLMVYTSEGNNYQGAHLARRFATDLGNAVNASLNERRWALVLSSAAGSKDSLERLRDGAAQLRAGAKELSDGAAQTAAGARTVNGGAYRLNDGVTQLIDGFRQLGTGLKTMDAARPAAADLARLKNGAEALAAGHVELERGFVELQSGTKRLRDGVKGFRDETADSILIPGRVTEGLDQVGDGIGQLDAGIHTAADAQRKLSDGANRLNAGVGTLTQGVQALGNGIHTAVTKLPEDRKLSSLGDGAGELLSGTTALAAGNDKVKAGTQRLHEGIELLVRSLPATVSALEGSAEGLANSVEPVVEVDAPVQNQGAGFAPMCCPLRCGWGRHHRVFVQCAHHAPPCTRFPPGGPVCRKNHGPGGGGDGAGAAGVAGGDGAAQDPYPRPAGDGAHAGRVLPHVFGHCVCPDPRPGRRRQGIGHAVSGGATILIGRRAAGGAERRHFCPHQPLDAHDLGGASPQGQHVWRLRQPVAPTHAASGVCGRGRHPDGQLCGTLALCPAQKCAHPSRVLNGPPNPPVSLPNRGGQSARRTEPAVGRLWPLPRALVED